MGVVAFFVGVAVALIVLQRISPKAGRAKR